LSQSRAKLRTELRTELRPNSSSSSSIIKTTTTRELDDEWNFDITPYHNFGFTSSQIKQLACLSIISATDVQQSLIEFNYDLSNNALPPIKTSKINFLMGLLRSGHSYVSATFKNEQEIIISEMARHAEEKRKKLLEEKFLVWEAALSEEEIKAIENKLPTELIVFYRTYGINNIEVRNWVFNYFLQNCGG
jgi:DNA-binding transcriptional regulator YiaG